MTWQNDNGICYIFLTIYRSVCFQT